MKNWRKFGGWGMAIFAALLYLLFVILGTTSTELTFVAVIIWLIVTLIVSALVSTLIAVITPNREKLFQYTATAFTILALGGVVTILLYMLLGALNIPITG